MKKERETVLILEGEITEEQIQKIPKDFRGDIIVNGNIVCLGKCEIPGSLWLNGNLEAENLRIEGDMFCKNSCNILPEKGVDISGDLFLKEACNIDATYINVGGDFEGNGTINSTDINVYGMFKFRGEIDLHTYKIYAGKLDLDARIGNCHGIKTDC